MPSQDHQQELDQALAKSQKNARELDRILWIVLPILAFLLSMIIANFTIASTIGSFVVMLVAFISVGIKKYSLLWVLSLSLLYCLIDNYWSYQLSLNSKGLQRQLLMLLFISIVAMSRRFAERALMNRQTL
jgi:hypothetical protein